MVNIIADVLFLIVLAVCLASKTKVEKDNSNKNEFIEKYSNIFLIALLMISLILLTYRISSVPYGLHVDEAGAFYDAISISNYGVDRYLYKLPVYFINFGGGQNALYTYLAAIIMKIFGANIVTFRLPAVILSLMSVAFLYKMVSENNGKREALFSAFILIVAPWFIMKSRWGLESYLMCSMMTISMAVFIKALNNECKITYALAGVLFGLTLYTYAISYLVVPAVLGITLIYGLIVKKVKIKNIICMAIPLGILAIPLMLMLAFNSGLVKSAKIPIFSIPELWFYRGGEISLRNVPENIKNMLDMLFIKDFLNYNAIEEFGTLYKLSIPLVVFGIIEVIRKVIKDLKAKECSIDFVMLLTFIVTFFVGLCVSELNINKINVIYIPMVYFAGRFLEIIATKSWNLVIIILLAYIINCALFVPYYFTEFAKLDLELFENDIMDASKRAEELKKDIIYVEDCLNQTYIYTLVVTPISPYEWNENLFIDGGNVIKYGKYVFEVPEDIDENAVYIIKDNREKIDQLVENGFELEEHGEFCVLFVK